MNKPVAPVVQQGSLLVKLSTPTRTIRTRGGGVRGEQRYAVGVFSSGHNGHGNNPLRCLSTMPDTQCHRARRDSIEYEGDSLAELHKHLRVYGVLRGLISIWPSHRR